MHNCLPTSLSFFCLATMGYHISGTYFSRPRQPLRSYVCNFDYGRRRVQSQEGDQRQELDLESVLYEQGTYTPVMNSSRVVTMDSDRSLCLLLPQRSLLHCAIPPFLLLAIPISLSTTSFRQWHKHDPPTWISSQPSTKIHLCQSPQRGCVGTRTSEQDGLIRAVGDSKHQCSNNGFEASHQCLAVDQG